MSGKAPDLTGQKFHMLTAIRRVGSKKCKDGRSESIWEWQCDCGKKVIAQARHVKYNSRGAKRSCGCWHRVKKCFGWKAAANSVFIRHYKDGDLTINEFIELAQQPCYYCCSLPKNKIVKKRKDRTDVFYYNGLDRIDQSKPHNRNNVIPCCWQCNERKSDWNMPRFLEWIATIYHNRIAA